MSSVSNFKDEYYKFYNFFCKTCYSYKTPEQFLKYVDELEKEIDHDSKTPERFLLKDEKKTMFNLLQLFRIKARIESESSISELDLFSRTMLTSITKTHKEMVDDFKELFNKSLIDALRWNTKNILEKKKEVKIPKAEEGFNRKLVEPVDEYIAKLNKIKIGLQYFIKKLNTPESVITATSRGDLEKTFEEVKKSRAEMLTLIQKYFEVIRERYKADAPSKEPSKENYQTIVPEIWDCLETTKTETSGEITLSTTQHFFDLLVKAAVQNDAAHIYGNSYPVPDIMINYWGTGTGKTLGSLLFICAEDITDCFIMVHSSTMIEQFIGDFDNLVGRKIINDRLPNCSSIEWRRVDIEQENSIAQFNLLDDFKKDIRRVYFMVYGDMFNKNIDDLSVNQLRNPRFQLFKRFQKDMLDNCNEPGFKYALIMDEAHTLRNTSGTWKKNIEYFFRGAREGFQNAPTMPIKRALFMTATLAANHLEQAIEVLDLACNVTATTDVNRLEEKTVLETVNGIREQVIKYYRKKFSKIYEEVLTSYGHANTSIKKVMEDIYNQFDTKQIKGDVYVDFLSELNDTLKLCGMVITRGLGGDEGMPKLNGERSFMAPTTTPENRGLLFWTNFPFKIPVPKTLFENIIAVKNVALTKQSTLEDKSIVCDEISWRKVTSAYFNIENIEIPFIFKELKVPTKNNTIFYSECDIGAASVNAMMEAMCEISGVTDYRAYLVQALNEKIKKLARDNKIINKDYSYKIITFKKNGNQWLEKIIVPDVIKLPNKDNKNVDAIQFRAEQFTEIKVEDLRTNFVDEKMKAIVEMIQRLGLNPENGPITVFAEHINGPDGVLHLLRRLNNSFRLPVRYAPYNICTPQESFEGVQYDYTRVASYTGAFQNDEEFSSFSDLEDRQKLVQKFNSKENWDGKNCKVIILTAAGSTGLTLRNSHVMIDIHVPDDVVVKQQKQGRTVRRNNGNGFTAGFLIEKATKDGNLCVPIVTEYCFLSTGNGDDKNLTFDEKTMESLKKKVTLGNLQSLAFTSVALNADIIANELEKPLIKKRIPPKNWKTLLIPNMKNLLTN